MGLKTLTSYSQHQVWHLNPIKSYNKGMTEVMAAVRFHVLFVASSVIKRVLFTTCFKTGFVSCTSKWHSLNYHVRLFSLKVSNDCICIYKQQVCVCICHCLSLFYFDCLLFLGSVSFPLPLCFAPPMPPVIVETTAVRILSDLVGYYLWPCLVSRLWNAW